MSLVKTARNKANRASRGAWERYHSGGERGGLQQFRREVYRGGTDPLATPHGGKLPPEHLETIRKAKAAAKGYAISKSPSSSAEFHRLIKAHNRSTMRSVAGEVRPGGVPQRIRLKEFRLNADKW